MYEGTLNTQNSYIEYGKLRDDPVSVALYFQVPGAMRRRIRLRLNAAPWKPRLIAF
jgi:hypothetical protein